MSLSKDAPDIEVCSYVYFKLRDVTSYVLSCLEPACIEPAYQSFRKRRSFGNHQEEEATLEAQHRQVLWSKWLHSWRHRVIRMKLWRHSLQSCGPLTNNFDDIKHTTLSERGALKEAARWGLRG